MLQAGLNKAKWRENGEIKEIPAGTLFDHPKSVDLFPAFALEFIPNRDSLTYETTYGLQDAKTVQRGTLRYRGFCEVMSVLSRIGLFDTNSHPALESSQPLKWKDLMARILKTTNFNEALKGVPDHVKAKLYG